MLGDSQGGKFTEAGVHLRTAAGIFERLHKVHTYKSTPFSTVVTIYMSCTRICLVRVCLVSQTASTQYLEQALVLICDYTGTPGSNWCVFPPPYALADTTTTARTPAMDWKHS